MALDWIRARLVGDAFREARSLTTALCLCAATRLLVIDQRLIVSESMQPTLAYGDRVLVDKVSILFGKLRPAGLGLRRNDIVVFRPPKSCRSLFAELLKNVTAPDEDGEEKSGLLKRAWERRRQAKRSPLNASLDFTKRVVAVAGDRVAVRKGVLYVNEQPARPFPRVLSLDQSSDRTPRDGEGCSDDYQHASYTLVTTVVPDDHIVVLGDNRDASFDSHVWGPLAVENVIGYAMARYWPIDRVAWFRRDALMLPHTSQGAASV